MKIVEASLNVTLRIIITVEISNPCVTSFATFFSFSICSTVFTLKVVLTMN